MPLRRIDIDVPVPYQTDVEIVRKILLGCLAEDERIVDVPAPLCRLYEYGSSALKYRVRCYVPNGEYWNVRFDLNERLFTRLRENGIEMPFEQVDVHLIAGDEADRPADGE